MIKISIDESSAFDILSIYQIKINNADNSVKKEQAQLSVTSLTKELTAQFGEVLFYEILNSPEYKKLYIANEKTFDAVDKAKTDEIPASIVDKCNHERYICKGIIQEKFFKTKMTETKIGYEKLKL